MDREETIIQSIIERLILSKYEIKKNLKEDICYIAIKEKRNKKLKNKYIMVRIEIKNG